MPLRWNSEFLFVALSLPCTLLGVFKFSGAGQGVVKFMFGLEYDSITVLLAIILLAFDVFRVALACVIGIALCCCLLCFIAILYAVSHQEGASDADLRILQRYRFKQTCGNGEKASARAGSMIPIAPTIRDPANKRALLHEDAECCICLTAYEDGTELQCLPCNHHFHAVCISRWLRITPTCPLCKYNILKANITV